MTSPSTIRDESELLEWMTRPSAELVESVSRLKSPLVILGAGGKMGPSLAVMARRAAEAAEHSLEIVAVSRFSDGSVRSWLEANAIATLQVDLLQPSIYGQLPSSENLVYLVGQKFGTMQNPSKTWAINTLVPSYCIQRYPESRIAALSSGNVYSFVSVAGKGSKESDPLTPLGEYANSCVARERIFEYWANAQGTPLILLRLSYALDLRYGVLVDIAKKVYQGLPIDVSTGMVNCIWQGDANEVILRSIELASQPPTSLNLTGPKWFSIRELAHEFGHIFHREPVFTGEESGTALLSNTERMIEKLGVPRTPVESLIQLTAEWIQSGGRDLEKPTHFDVRNGAY